MKKATADNSEMAASWHQKGAKVQMEGEKATSPELDKKVDTGLPDYSKKMVYLGVDRGFFCRRCATKVEEGRACGEKLTAVFWYCPTCDKFLEWHAFGITEQMTEQYQASVRSFLRWLRYHAETGEGNNKRTVSANDQMRGVRLL